MKRKPLILSLALLLIVGAAIWGVNWRLNDPPLTEADKKFRALVASADSVYIYQYRDQIAHPSPPTVRPHTTIVNKNVSGEQMRNLIKTMRLTDVETASFNKSSGGRFFGTRTELRFLYIEQCVANVTLFQTPRESLVVNNTSAPNYSAWRLNPRFDKSLRRALDQIAPHRLRP